MLPRVKKAQRLSNLNAINFTRSQKQNIKLPSLHINYDQTSMLGHWYIPSQDTSTFRRTFHEEGKIYCKQKPICSEKRLKQRDWRCRLCHVPSSRLRVFKSVQRTSSSQFHRRHFLNTFIKSTLRTCGTKASRALLLQFQVSYCRVLIYFQLYSFEKQKSQFSRAMGTYNWTNDFFQ